MVHLIQYYFLSSLAVILAYVTYYVLYIRGNSYRRSRSLVIGIIGFSILSPLVVLMYDLLSVQTVIPSIQYPELIIGAVQNSDLSVENGYSIFHLLVSIYVLGMAIVSLRFFTQLFMIYRLRKVSSLVHWKTHNVYLHETDLPPFSFFNAIYLSKEDFETEFAESLLIHESIHLQGHHSLDIFLLQIFQTIFWFNPVYVLIKRELQTIHEFICDQKAINSIPENEYRIALLSYSIANAGIPITNSFNQSNLKRRFSMMKKSKPKKLGLKSLMLIPVLGLCVIVMYAMIPINPSMSVTDSDSIADKVDTNIVPPTYPGGDAARQKFISENIEYPKEAIKAGVQGTIYVQFIVEKTGSLRDVNVIRGIQGDHPAGKLIEEEAIRVIKLMPNWSPATKSGKVVEMQMALPLKFKLDPKKEKE